MRHILKVLSLVLFSASAFGASQGLGTLLGRASQPTIHARLESVTRSRPNHEAAVRWKRRMEIDSRLRRYATSPNTEKTGLLGHKRTH